jgi:hypothetical protein
MQARLLFLKYLNIKQRLLKRPRAIMASGRRPSAWHKSLDNVKAEARLMMNNPVLSSSDKTLLRAIINEGQYD